MSRYGTSMRRATSLLKLSRSVYLYRSQARDASVLKLRIKEIADTRVHYGYRRVHVMLRREGFKDNHKRVYRVYRDAGLSLRHRRPRRNKAARLRQPKQIVTAMNEIWSMDFVSDATFDGRKLRALTVVDCYTRECLAIAVGQSLKGGDVVTTLNRIVAARGMPATIKADNGSEFISKVMDRWAYERGIEMDFSRPGKPTDNESPRVLRRLLNLRNWSHDEYDKDNQDKIFTGIARARRAAGVRATQRIRLALGHC